MMSYCPKSQIYKWTLWSCFIMIMLFLAQHINLPWSTIKREDQTTSTPKPPITPGRSGKELSVLPPSTSPYHFENPQNKLNLGGEGQPAIVDAILKQKREGFFVECGALDGEFMSNSLFFELERNWTGLLIEPDPKSFEKLKSKNRRAYLVNTCIDANQSTVEFVHDKVWGWEHILAKGEDRTDKKISTIQCFPFYEIIQAVGNPTVDYFSLDVNNVEFEILQSIPWEKVDIKVITVEFQPDVTKINHSVDDVVHFMESKGYKLHMYMKKLDLIFVKNQVFRA